MEDHKFALRLVNFSEGLMKFFYFQYLDAYTVNIEKKNVHTRHLDNETLNHIFQLQPFKMSARFL